MPSATRHTMNFGVEENGSEIIAFSRIERPDTLLQEEIVYWVSSFLGNIASEDARDEDDENLEVRGSFTPMFDVEFDAVWNELAEIFGMPISVDEVAKPCMVVPDSGVPVSVEYRPDAGDVILRSVLSILPTEATDDERLFKNLLQAHLFGLDTAGAVFAVDEDAEEIIVWRAESIRQLRADRLAMLIENVSAVARYFEPKPETNHQETATSSDLSWGAVSLHQTSRTFPDLQGGF